MNRNGMRVLSCKTVKLEEGIRRDVESIGVERSLQLISFSAASSSSFSAL